LRGDLILGDWPGANDPTAQETGLSPNNWTGSSGAATERPALCGAKGIGDDAKRSASDAGASKASRGLSIVVTGTVRASSCTTPGINFGKAEGPKTFREKVEAFAE
jgi:hypothetical protein